MHGGGIVINEMTEEIGIAQFALKFHCVLKKITSLRIINNLYKNLPEYEVDFIEKGIIVNKNRN